MDSEAMRKIVLRGHKGIEGKAEGEALVTKNPINLFADVDPVTGKVISKATLPDLYGKSIAGKVLVFPTGKGGTWSVWWLAELAERGVGPKAMINVRSHPIFVHAAIVSKVPLVDRLDKNPLEIIETGDYVRVDAKQGIIEVEKKN